MKLLLITDAVGWEKANKPEDVSAVQELLNKQSFATHKTLQVDGKFGAQTGAAIVAFQRKVMGMQHPDGVVSILSTTYLKLMLSNIVSMVEKPISAPSSSTGSAKISEQQYQNAAKLLQVDVATIKAVSTVETGPYGAFDEQGRPTILFEPHQFHLRTKPKGAYDKTHPDLSSPSKRPKRGPHSIQYSKLERAKKLDSDAALKSTSWGAFQIMGFNYHDAGYDSVDDFVSAMQQSVDNQLDAFVHLINHNNVWKHAMQKKDWTTFAKNYNGPDYQVNKYDTKLADAYAANGGK